MSVIVYPPTFHLAGPLCERVVLMAHTPAVDGEEQPDHEVLAWCCPEDGLVFLDAELHGRVFHLA